MFATKRIFGEAVVFLLGLMFAGMATAAPVIMNFDGMTGNAGSGEYVNNYYNGGCSSSYSGGATTCGGPNYGVVWSNAIACGAPAGLCANAANEPSSPNVMVFLSSTSAYMNVAAGFMTGFSFYYAAPYYSGFINVYSGLDGSGTLLATLNLPTNGSDCNGFSQNYSCWSAIGVSFSGTAESVGFGGTADYIVFDNVTLGSSTPVKGVPEPGVLGLFGLGVLLIGLLTGLRQRMH